MRFVIITAFGVFISIFIIKSILGMTSIPFYDFDEAHRAENARTMMEYKTFIAPLSGSPYDRDENLKVPLKGSSNYYLYYHLERPPLVYWLMIASTAVFGPGEFSYRLPSFLFGMGTVIMFYFFSRRYFPKVKAAVVSLSVSLLCLLTSSDLWLSSQYAQLDTALTFFMFTSLLLLLVYCEKNALKRNKLYLFLSGVSLGLAILSKGQPVAIFVFPLLALLLMKKLNWRELLLFIFFSALVTLPWLVGLTLEFGLLKFITVFSEFAVSSSISKYLHIEAPIYWYLKWFWESFRPGWTLFLAFLIFDILNFKLNWRKGVVLSYALGGFIFFSFAVNKIWWYVLPLVPALVYYLYLATSDYLKNNKGRLVNLSLVIIVASLPIVLGQRNIYTLVYGFAATALSSYVLFDNQIQKIKFLYRFKNWLFIFSIALCLLLFSFRFPKIVPFHEGTKWVAEYYSSLPEPKCLWIYDMPTEAALFYSKAGQVSPLTSGKLQPNCHDYLITPTGDRKNIIDPFFPDNKLILEKDELKLYQLEL